MSCNHPAASLLPFLVNGTVDAAVRRDVEEHVAGCEACRTDLGLWNDVAGAVRAEVWGLPGISDTAWRRLDAARRLSTTPRLLHAAALVRAQVLLVRQGLWLSSALLMAMGFVVAWVAGRSGLITGLAPLVAAFGVSRLHGPQHDPAFELTQATPTSGRAVLLARLVLVFGYDLVLALGASAALSVVLPGTVLWTVVGSWLAPMTFLSALALVGSMVIGNNAAVALALALWLGRGVVSGPGLLAQVTPVSAAYEAVWSHSSWLFLLAAVFVALAFWLAARETRLPASAA